MFKELRLALITNIIMELLSYKEVKNALLKAKEKGYSDAYIAAFENGEKTSLSKVLK